MYEAHLNERKKDFDWPLLLATGALAVTGVLFIFSATEEASQGQPLYRQTFFLQIIWLRRGWGRRRRFAWWITASWRGGRGWSIGGRWRRWRRCW